MRTPPRTGTLTAALLALLSASPWTMIGGGVIGGTVIGGAAMPARAQETPGSTIARTIERPVRGPVEGPVRGLRAAVLPPVASVSTANGGATGAGRRSRAIPADLPAALKADRIVFTTGYRMLRASGNVEITYGSVMLSARALTYDAVNNRITAEGPIRLRDGDSVTILADFARLTTDMREGILRSARMVLNRQMQLTATEIRRSGGRYTRLFRAAASACTINRARPTPLWQIRASQIIHDQQRKLLFFENAELRLGGVPVAWLPRLRLPDPSVRRASGFLVPEIANSDRLGLGLSAPYFVTLGDYADATLTPTLYSSGTATLAVELRRRFRNGAITATGAVSRDSVSIHSSRAYLFADGAWRLAGGMQLGLRLQLASDRDYLREHGFSATTRLENAVTLNRTRRASQLSAALAVYRPLAAINIADQIPQLLGDVSYRRRWQSALAGGQIGMTVSALGYVRRSTADILGRDGRRLSARLDWSRQWITGRGLLLQATAAVRADSYGVQQDSRFAPMIQRTVPLVALDWRWPLGRRRGQVQEVLQPRLQLVWSPGSSVAVPDEDSPLVEFGPANLFSLDHFSGTDRVERGLRANVGITWSRRAADGWNFEGLLGRVIRLSDQGQFTAASGLSGASSGVVVAAQVTRMDRLRMVQRMVFVPGGGISRSETRLAVAGKRFDIDSSYLWLAQNNAGNSLRDRSEWLVQAGWQIGRGWRSQANWRYDLVTGAPSDAGVLLTYRNECLKVDLSLSRSFLSSSNVSASTNIGIKVALEGFGTGSPAAAGKTSCARF